MSNACIVGNVHSVDTVSIVNSAGSVGNACSVDNVSIVNSVGSVGNVHIVHSVCAYCLQCPHGCSGSWVFTVLFAWRVRVCAGVLVVVYWWHE